MAHISFEIMAEEARITAGYEEVSVNLRYVDVEDLLCAIGEKHIKEFAKENLNMVVKK